MLIPSLKNRKAGNPFKNQPHTEKLNLKQQTAHCTHKRRTKTFKSTSWEITSPKHLFLRCSFPGLSYLVLFRFLKIPGVFGKTVNLPLPSSVPSFFLCPLLCFCFCLKRIPIFLFPAWKEALKTLLLYET